MLFYWRLIEELRELGEHSVIIDPSLKRCYNDWLRKHAAALPEPPLVNRNVWIVHTPN